MTVQVALNLPTDGRNRISCENELIRLGFESVYACFRSVHVDGSKIKDVIVDCDDEIRAYDLKLCAVFQPLTIDLADSEKKIVELSEVIQFALFYNTRNRVIFNLQKDGFSSDEFFVRDIDTAKGYDKKACNQIFLSMNCPPTKFITMSFG